MFRAIDLESSGLRVKPFSLPYVGLIYKVYNLMGTSHDGGCNISSEVLFLLKVLPDAATH